MALGGSSMDIGWGGASTGSGDSESNTCSSSKGGGSYRSSGSETDIERRISIIAIQVSCVYINC
jgi:hypothetical protein